MRPPPALHHPRTPAGNAHASQVGMCQAANGCRAPRALRGRRRRAPAAAPSPPTCAPLPPVLVLGAINPLKDFLQGQADYFGTLGLPGWLVQWVSAPFCAGRTGGCGSSAPPAPTSPAPPPPPVPLHSFPQGHPGNMAVVLAAMGFYGCGYLGWQIRSGEDPAAVAKATDLHPKLAVGMTMFFALVRGREGRVRVGSVGRGVGRGSRWRWEDVACRRHTTPSLSHTHTHTPRPRLQGALGGSMSVLMQVCMGRAWEGARGSLGGRARDSHALTAQLGAEPRAPLRPPPPHPPRRARTSGPPLTLPPACWGSCCSDSRWTRAAWARCLPASSRGGALPHPHNLPPAPPPPHTPPPHTP